MELVKWYPVEKDTFDEGQPFIHMRIIGFIEATEGFAKANQDKE